jgi:hypothetical protein
MDAGIILLKRAEVTLRNLADEISTFCNAIENVDVPFKVPEQLAFPEIIDDCPFEPTLILQKPIPCGR